MQSLVGSIIVVGICIVMLLMVDEVNTNGSFLYIFNACLYGSASTHYVLYIYTQLPVDGTLSYILTYDHLGHF